MGARVGSLKTKTSEFETPALLPVIHPARQILPCKEIKEMGYRAVMTNAYTTFRKLIDRAPEGIHRIIDFDGSIMTDSGGYQVLEYGSVDITPEEMALFEEKIGSDIAIVLDQPTGLRVAKKYASSTVRATLEAARTTKRVSERDDIIWTLPLQGGKYLDLVSKSARSSAKLDFGCYALGSPVEVMEEYDFSLLVDMILASKRNLPLNRPFHLFGAGHPLILPIAISLGCDMFDSASYMLYAKQDRYISSTGTIRLEKLEYLGCECKTCCSLTAQELKRMKGEERTLALARHNLFALKRVIEETKQAIWEGRLWEYVKANSYNHPRALVAFKKAVSLQSRESFEIGTPAFKERGVFLSDESDLNRPEISRFRRKLRSLDFAKKSNLIVIPETRTKPFLKSKIYLELLKLVKPEDLIVCACPNFGLVPAEISDIYPISQTNSALEEFPKNDWVIRRKNWKKIKILFSKNSNSKSWLLDELSSRYSIPRDRIAHKELLRRGKTLTKLSISKSYKSFKTSASS